jgi:FAD/FMN-containing dehydrogenase
VTHEAACRLGHVAPALSPALNRLSVVLWSNRDFTDVASRVFATYRPVRFREMEYALPVENVRPAFEAVRTLIEDRGWRIGFPIEVRFAAEDDLWLSTAHGRASGYIAVHRYWREDPTEYFEAVEQIMLAHGGRPHWGKMHTLDAAILRDRYPRFDDFIALRDRLDPDRMFRNSYLDRVLGE